MASVKTARPDVRRIIQLGFFGLMLAVVVLFLTSQGLVLFAPQMPAVAGRLDLSAQPLDDRTNRTLNGEWAFYWQQLLTHTDFSTAEQAGSPLQPDLTATIPSVWNHYQRNGEALPAFGYATYRLTVTGADPASRLMIQVDSMATAYRLFIDDTLMTASGEATPGLDGFVPAGEPRTIRFRPTAATFDIIIQVSNYTYARGGSWYQINFGTEAAVERLLMILRYKDALLLGALLALTLYHFNFFIMLREMASGLLLLLDLAMSIRILVYGDYLIFALIPGLPFRMMVQLNYLSLYWTPIFFYLTIESLFFAGKRSPEPEGLIQAGTTRARDWFGRRQVIRTMLLVYGTVLSAAALLLPISVFTGWLVFTEAVLLIIFAGALLRILQAFRMKRRGASFIFLITLLSTGLILHDVLYQQNIIHSAVGELTPIGLVAMLFTLSVVTAGRLIEGSRERHLLADQLMRSHKVEQRLEKQMQQFLQARTRVSPVEMAESRVLILMDTGNWRSELANVLRQDGFAVSVQTGSAGLADLLSSGHLTDGILLDLRTTTLSGFEILRRIRERYTPAELPVLLLTSRENIAEATTGFWLGANDTISLPCADSELIIRVRNLFQMQHWIDRTVTTELSLLQAQIKPHFVFNTLSAISSRILRSPAEAKALLLDFSDYLRESFDFESKDGLTVLSRELKLVRSYLAIEQARFQARLKVRYEIDQTVDCPLPILSIQPIVENAIRHGLMPLPEGGEILIHVTCVQDHAMILVADNGLGMTAEQCASLFAADAPDTGQRGIDYVASALDTARRGIGLRNTNHRLLTLYGHGLQISSAPGQGTEVRFEIPLPRSSEVSI